MADSDNDDDPADLRSLELTQRELNLLLKYTYPFPEQAEVLRTSQAKNGFHRVQIDRYWISMLIGDLVYSAKKIRSQRLLEELDVLCSVLEAAENNLPRIHIAWSEPE